MEDIAYGSLIAKIDKNDHENGLPLWMHLYDTAGVADKMVREWLPNHIFDAAGLEFEIFRKTAVFCAALHDVGKATSFFQSIITKQCPEQRDVLLDKGFEVKDEYINKGKTPHAWAGQWIIQSTHVCNGVSSGIANVIGAHHGRTIEKIYRTDPLEIYPVNFYGTESNGLKKKKWIECWENIISDASDLAGFEKVSDIPDISTEAQVLLSGLIIAADWIASNTNLFPLISFDEFIPNKHIYPERINNGWEKAHFPDIWESEIRLFDDEIFMERFGFFPNEIQSEVFDTINRCSKPGIFILEAPMGSGKTEAALGAAEVIANKTNSSGIFFGLPTQATSNGIFERLYDWASNVSEETTNALRLAHGAADYNDDYLKYQIEGKSYVNDIETEENLIVHPWFQGNKKALLADFVIGTVDQFLMASLKRKHFMLRHIGLAGKVVIIDECHAYDSYMNKYLERSIQWMAAYGVPIILLSATLPHKRRRSLVLKYISAYSKNRSGKKIADISADVTDWDSNQNYPLFTWTDGESICQRSIPSNMQKKEIHIRTINSEEAIINTLEERLSDGGCACIIVNTVRKAQQIFDLLSDNMHDYQIILYHAQFTIPDRNKKEQLLKKKLGKNSKESDRDKVILIGTQVLEQSLDFDADIMMTQLCPMDLFLQRIGRLHRHDRLRPEKLKNAECYILEDEEDIFDKGSLSIYGEYLLKRTHRFMPETILIPDDISRLVQIVYSEGQDEQEEPGYFDYKKKIQNMEEKAKNYLLPQPSRRGITGMLINDNTTDEKYAESGVRDASSSIEVILVKKDEHGMLTTVEKNEFTGVSVYDIPDINTGREIAKERIRLPAYYSSPYNLIKTITELEDRNINELSAWQDNPWLNGELILLLDNNCSTELLDTIITYDPVVGLKYSRREKENE